MTEYLKKSFTIRFHAKAKTDKCVKCGIELPVVIYKLNREPVCHDCFKRPKGEK